MTLILPEHVRHAMLAKLTGPSRQWTLRQVCETTNPKTVWTPALDIISDAAQRCIDTPNGRLIIAMPPQEGKSTTVSINLPIWQLIRNPDCRIVTGSYGQSLANRNGRAVRNHIKSHPEFGLRIASDNGAASEWEIEGRAGGMVAVGRGAGVTGRPVDLLIVDDPIKDRAEADSRVIRDTCRDWWTDALAARFGGDSSAIVVATRWHEDDLSGWLASQGGWEVLNIPAQCEDPATDPLGRQLGEYMVSARGRTREQWELRKREAGARTWAALYQGHPSPADGDIFQREWFAASAYTQPLAIVRSDGAHLTTSPGDQLMISVDATFKGTEHSDYVVMQVWLRRGMDAYMLDQVRGQMSFPETCDALVALSAKWPQAVLKLVEDKANGPAIMAQLARVVPGMVPEEPQGGKTARANAVTPFCEAGNVHLPSPHLAPWIGDLLEELAAFPNGAHDDQVDALTQAVNRLLLQPLLSGNADLVVTDELFDEMDEQGFIYAPY